MHDWTRSRRRNKNTHTWHTHTETHLTQSPNFSLLRGELVPSNFLVELNSTTTTTKNTHKKKKKISIFYFTGRVNATRRPANNWTTNLTATRHTRTKKKILIFWVRDQIVAVQYRELTYCSRTNGREKPGETPPTHPPPPTTGKNKIKISRPSRWWRVNNQTGNTIFPIHLICF